MQVFSMGRSAPAALCLVLALFSAPADAVGPEPPARGPHPMIAGGSSATIGAFPWQVAILDNQFPEPRRAQICGGSVIAERWVLTAAHCVTPENVATPLAPNSRDIVVGSALFTTGRRIHIDRIVVHPGWDWDKNKGANDIALLHAAQPLLGANVQAVDIADPATPVAGNLVVAGWGARFKGDSGTGQLQQVTVPYVSDAVCEAGYNGTIKVTDKRLCAGFAAGGKGACKGDSGGALVTYGNGPRLPGIVGPYAIQVGIDSWSEPGTCAAPNKYGVYTRVGMYRDWIMQTMGLPPSPSHYQPMLGETWDALSQTYWNTYSASERQSCEYSLDPLRRPNLNLVPYYQSPIALVSTAELDSYGLPRLDFKYSQSAAALALVNDGHGIQLVFDRNRYKPGADLRLPGITAEPPEQRLALGSRIEPLVAVQFHHPSEHVLDGQRYPLEIELIHHGEPTSHWSVVSVFVTFGKKNDALAPVFDKMDAARSANARAVVQFSGQALAAALPADKTYLGYEGSLTTPPCYNSYNGLSSVTHAVLRTPIEASPAQIEQVKNAIRYGRPGTPVNARPLQFKHEDYHLSQQYQ